MKRALVTVTITIPMTRSEVTHHDRGATSWRPVPDGTLTGTVTLLIDAEAIARDLGAKALRSKGGKARGLGGLVEVIADRTSKQRTR